MGWVSIGVALFSTLAAVVFWLIRRRVTRLDALEAAVFGDSGVRERLHKYVTHEALDRKLNSLNEKVAGISEEGQRREDRILEAITNQTLVVGSEVREIKTDMRAQAARIDEAIRIATRQDR
jgi:hypothetical protein